MILIQLDFNIFRIHEFSYLNVQVTEIQLQKGK